MHIPKQYWENYDTETILEGECVSKYDLLKSIKEVFSKNIDIIPKKGFGSNKCIKGTIKTSNILNQLIELKKEYYNL